MRPGITIAIAVGILLTGWMIFAPVYDGPYKRQHASEASAVGTIRTINLLEGTYAAKEDHFTCNLADINEMTKYTVKLFPDTIGLRSGYVFTLRGCAPGPSNEKYQVVAVPREPGVTGFRAFCSDESGYISYDKNGSGEDCLSRKKKLD